MGATDAGVHAAYLEQCQQQGLWRDLDATGDEELIEAIAAEEVPEQDQEARSLAREEEFEQAIAYIYERIEAIVEEVAIAIASTPQPQRKQPYAIDCTSVIPLRRRPQRRQLRPTHHKPKQ